jgi:hypothetical protein
MTRSPHSRPVFIIPSVAVAVTLAVFLSLGSLHRTLPSAAGPVSYPGGGAPSHITSVSWSFSRCWNASTVVGPWAYDGVPFTVSVNLTLPASAAGCTAQSVNLSGPDWLRMVSASVPLTVGPGSSPVLQVELVTQTAASLLGVANLSVAVT